MNHDKVYQMRVSKVYPLLVNKALKKGRTQSEVDEVIRWLTGYDQAALEKILESDTDYAAFFQNAPKLNPNRKLITGVVCGIRVETIAEPLMQEIRYLDKLVDELAKGKAMEKILRNNRGAMPCQHTTTDLGGGADMTEQERTSALKVVTSIIVRCERVQPKFAPGTSQHTLLKNRIQAMKIAEALLTRHGAESYSTQEMSVALEPLVSVIRKCEKARSKYEPDSGQYGRYGGTIQAMELSRTLIEDELLRRPL